MKYPILISLFIHGIFFASLYGFKWNEQQNSEATYVSLINRQNSQSPRLKKIKGSAGLDEQDKVKEKVGEKKTSVLKGQDKENVEERLSSKASNTNPAFMNYAQELQLFIEKNQYYPRRALVMGQQGEVQIRFKINKEGSFSNIEILEQTQYEILNTAAFDLIVSLKSFKPLPKEYRGQGEFIVPIRYQIKVQ